MTLAQSYSKPETRLQQVILSFFPFATYSACLTKELPKAEGEAR